MWLVTADYLRPRSTSQRPECRPCSAAINRRGWHVLDISNDETMGPRLCTLNPDTLTANTIDIAVTDFGGRNGVDGGVVDSHDGRATAGDETKSLSIAICDIVREAVCGISSIEELIGISIRCIGRAKTHVFCYFCLDAICNTYIEATEEGGARIFCVKLIFLTERNGSTAQGSSRNRRRKQQSRNEGGARPLKE
jgi:hypothetical protein